VIPAPAQQISLIPAPTILEIHEGTYTYPSLTPVYAFDEFLGVASLLSEHPFAQMMPAERIKSHKRIPEGGIRLIRARPEDQLSADAYRLIVDTGSITIVGHQPSAVINGILSLLQLAYTQPDAKVLPALMIEDRPRFAYRGLHLDVSKHFYPISFLKRFIDLMALYKFNTFHWHLADDAGWRLEIKQYPALTQRAAWRTHVKWSDWWENGRRYLDSGHPNASGGYYTQSEARELVAYAARKGITIIPEIELPAHSAAVLAVYPELSCSGKPYAHTEYCLGKEQTFVFLTRVLNELIDIFPSEYVHIGGGEVHTNSWASCQQCQALMEREGLKEVIELQGYMIKRIDSLLRSRGKKLIGWDGILEAGASAGTTVMSRQSQEIGLQAVNAGHPVIMAPRSYLSFDRYQSEEDLHPQQNTGYTPLHQVYAYDPIPGALPVDKLGLILGAEGTVCTEYLPTWEQVEYMVFPRALALAEVVWSDPKKHNWTDFQQRLKQHYPLLQRFQVNYYRPSYTVGIDVVFNADTLTNTISMSTEQLDLGIRYTTNGQDPDLGSALYTKPIELSVPATVKAAFFIDSARVGPIAEAKADLHKAIGKSIIYQTKWEEQFPARGDSTLLNGQKGGKRADDGQWQGFSNNFDITIDFQRREAINSVSIDFLQDPSVNAFLPDEVMLLFSDNGKNYREAGKRKIDGALKEGIREIKTFTFTLDSGQTARYVRLVATNIKSGLLLTDEVVVY